MGQFFKKKLFSDIICNAGGNLGNFLTLSHSGPDFGWGNCLSLTLNGRQLAGLGFYQCISLN